jgi:hypothetical protein
MSGNPRVTTKTRFVWSCLLSFLGWEDYAKLIAKDPNRVTGDPPTTCDEMLDLLSNYVHLPRPRRNEVLKILESLRDMSTKLIVGEHFWNEDIFPRVPLTDGVMDDSSHIAEKQEDYLCAICAYLLRSYCTLRTASTNDGMDYGGAQIALKDLVQADMLLNMLCRHTNPSVPEIAGIPPLLCKEYAEKLEHYLKGTIEVFRGNVHFKLRNRKRAERHYKRGKERFQDPKQWDKLLKSIEEGNPGSVDPRFQYLVSPTLAKTKFELSKICLDEGLFLAALVWQLAALRDLTLVACYLKPEGGLCGETERQTLQRTCDHINYVMEKLRICQDQPFFPKKDVQAWFGGGEEYGECTKQFDPGVFSGLPFHSSHTYYVSDILSRIAFVLVLLRISSLDAKREKYGLDHITRILNIATNLLELKEWSNHNSSRPSNPWAIWGRMLLPTNDDELNKVAIGDLFDSTPERLLALHVLHSFTRNKADLDKNGDELVDLASRLGRKCMQYIDNVVTIPQQTSQHLMREGYKGRTKKLRETHNGGALNKLAVLRRWQSYNPKVPHPRSMDIRGGGLFLHWYGKGIVIDPGYNFVQNFYDQGYSLEDIDAVVLTHAHPDHDDELSTILTLLAEWNEFWTNNCGTHQPKKIDLFVNEASFRNFDVWVHAEKVVVANIYTLQTNIWDKGEQNPSNFRQRRKNQRLFLREKGGQKGDGKYYMDIEVIPAWHDELIDKRTAVGVVFNLFTPEWADSSTYEPLKVGVTGDTKYFASTQSNGSELSAFYEDCDVVVAHLGDIRLREVGTILRSKGGDAKKHIEPGAYEFPLKSFTIAFLGLNDDGEFDKELDRTKVQTYMRLVTNLDLVDIKDLEGWHLPENQTLEIEDLKGNLLKTPPLQNLRQFVQYLLHPESTVLKELLTYRVNVRYMYSEKGKEQPTSRRMTLGDWRKATRNLMHESGRRHYSNPAMVLLRDTYPDLEAMKVKHILAGAIQILCDSALRYFEPKYHLGLRGLKRIHDAMIEERKPGSDPLADYKKPKNPSRVLVIGELPEELGSYRHHIARELSQRKSNNGKVACLTGDIGLTIGLETKGVTFAGNANKTDCTVAVRCSLCNFNNEFVTGDTKSKRVYHYHPPIDIQETVLVREGNSMVYLCKSHHASTPIEQPIFFPNYIEL